MASHIRKKALRTSGALANQIFCSSCYITSGATITLNVHQHITPVSIIPELGLFSELTCEILLWWMFTEASKNHCLSPGKSDRWPSTLREKLRLGWQSEQPGRPMFYLSSLCKIFSKVDPSWILVL